jgi:hypothetical protein
MAYQGDHEHAQRIVVNGVLIVPPRDFQYPHVVITKRKKLTKLEYTDT